MSRRRGRAEAENRTWGRTQAGKPAPLFRMPAPSRLLRQCAALVLAALALILLAPLPGSTLSQATFPPPGAGAQEVPPRTPRYPLKTARMLRSDAELAQARANVERYPSARQVRDRLVAAADPWLAWEDEDLARLVTPASVPRAFDVSAQKGCPKCGNEIHERFGT